MPYRKLEKLIAINRFLNLEFTRETELQGLAKLAAQMCQVPLAIITIGEKDNLQYIKYQSGDFSVEPKLRSYPFCKFLTKRKQLLIIPDAKQDERFNTDPFVIGSPYIRFYVCLPLITRDGKKIGSLELINEIPARLSDQQQEMLISLSRQIINLLEFDFSLKILRDQFTNAKMSETVLRSFFESSSSCHLLINQDLKVLAFNSVLSKFTEDVYGFKISIGMSALEFTHPSYTDIFYANCKDALSGNSIHIEQYISYKHKGVWWYITYDPALDPRGQIIGISYNATDITGRKEQEKQVMEQNEMLRKIAYIQSHEIRRPVASILGLMNLFEMADYKANREEMLLLKKAADELDQKIREIVTLTIN